MYKRQGWGHVGPPGAGHFVKMIHNGIEYADMQFIGEAYDLLKGAGLSAAEAADVFAQWNTGDLDSYLIEITAEVPVSYTHLDVYKRQVWRWPLTTSSQTPRRTT